MHGLSPHDGARTIDWGQTSVDYAQWRPDYPNEFYTRLLALGIGLPGQRILDVGTGVGFLALNFARQGAAVTGIDLSAQQIDQARRAARAAGLDIRFVVGRAEESGLPDGEFDVITASQCWLYFDCDRMISEVRRLLRPGGILATCHFCWLPLTEPLARASEELVLQYNSDWSAAGWEGHIPRMPAWADRDFDLVNSFVFDAEIPFTREQWRGRLRACRGVGAALTREQVEAFDREHALLLERIAPDTFGIRHRIDCHLLRLKVD